MTKHGKALDPSFVEGKRRELLALRKALRGAAGNAETEEGGVQDEAAQQLHEPEDDAQRLELLEKEGLLVSRHLDRLGLIDRALAKIDVGTYGISDISGEPIDEERLNAVPEAVNTLREQEAIERQRVST
jgi:DnaK suppressor protein